MSGAIWLASYPKSGNTWARLMLLSLQDRGDAIELHDLSRFGHIISTHELLSRWLDVESGDLTPGEILSLRPDFHAVYCTQPGSPQFIKVHDAWIRTPSGRPVFEASYTQATLYFIRDPRDVAISWARFTGQTIDAAIADLGNPKSCLGSHARKVSQQLSQPMGRWCDHVTSWVDESDLAPLVVRYEDMLAAPHDALFRMAKHVGWAPDDVAIRSAVAGTEFDLLAEQEKRHGFFERTDKTDRFFHTGRAGAWREVLSADQAARIEREHQAIMRRFGYC